MPLVGRVVHVLVVVQMQMLTSQKVQKTFKVPQIQLINKIVDMQRQVLQILDQVAARGDKDPEGADIG